MIIEPSKLPFETAEGDPNSTAAHIDFIAEVLKAKAADGNEQAAQMLKQFFPTHADPNAREKLGENV